LRVNRALNTFGKGNRMVLRASDEHELLRDMCHVIVESGGYRSAYVVYAEHDARKSTRWMFGIGPNIEAARMFPFTWDDTEEGCTVTGTTIRTGQPVVGRVFDDAEHKAGPAYARFMAQAVKDGYGAVSGFPLCVDGEVLGALVISSDEPDAFDDLEVELLNALADDLAYGISHLRVRAQHREARATLLRLAYADTLTGLPNRAKLLEVLQGEMAAAKEQARTLALLHLEVSGFHEINKVLGYQAGDALLQELRHRLDRVVQEDELLARVGEAEFALLLPRGKIEYARWVAERLVAELHAPVDLGEFTVDAHVEIGVALFPDHATDADTLIRRANAVMHQVKPTRGGFAVYTDGQEKEQTRRLALMGDLHRAISNTELRLYCQPKVDMRSRRVCGAEALVRWVHPVHGMMSPLEFIQLAEQAGMITPLTNWMLEAVFRQSHEWNEAGRSLPLAINLSAHDLYDAGLIDRIRCLFSRWDIEPEMIQFELTESALMADPLAALETLVHLKRLNVRLFIDDYGTGYSSLSYLQQLPVDAIKIDQSFVRAMARSRDSAVIISSTIELGHKLGMEVLAEGVETRETWDRLAALGCDVAQGYLISMPMPANDLNQWERGWSQDARIQ
jgi:diguanylate cyclase (GGDEF)-like protein